jgi:hypothetical protein
MQGIWIDGERPKSKKAIREAVALDPTRVKIEATSVFGNDYSGPVFGAPVGRYHFVGPDPYTSRKFYGTITVAADGKLRVK